MEVEVIKDLLKSLKEAVEDGEVVIIDSGCGEVLDMIDTCGVSNSEEAASEYEKRAIELADQEGWQIVEKNNCKAVKL